jgi:DNA-binding winged helix-turn-helix (wHTH) protein
MTTNSYAEPAVYSENPPPHHANRSSQAAAEATLEFGRFRVLLRQRQLVADGVPIELGTRTLDLLLVLLEADGSLVTKEELMSRVWPGIVVAEENLKVQISALRKALGEDRDLIRTEFGRGYRFTAAVRSTVARSVGQRPTRWRRRSRRRLVRQWVSRRPPQGWSVPRSLRPTLWSRSHWGPHPSGTGAAHACEKERKRGDV